MIDNESLNAAIHATIAKQILEGLGTEARDALVLKAMTRTLSDYSFASAVNKVVSDKAARVVAELVESDEWTRRITDTVREGFEGYLISLRAAVTEEVKEMMHGRQGSYGSAGRVLGNWPKAE